MLADTHAHLTMPEYQDISTVLHRAKSAGIEFIIDVAYDLESANKSVELAGANESVYSAVGIHPHDAKSYNKDMLKTIKLLLQKPKVVAIGETGLDYHYKLSAKEDQKTLFVQLVKIAKEFELPLIVHGRESYEDIIDILETEGEGKVKGVFHSFSGSVEQANWATSNNFFISFSGMLTFKKAANIVEIATAVPIEKMLLETDSPYLTPEPFRGRRNEPSFIRYVAEKLSQIKGITPEEAGRITTNNAKKLFRI
ncbi:TatD family hydrolase [Candidatus Margulisiibacteriota bacterium]